MLADDILAQGPDRMADPTEWHDNAADITSAHRIRVDDRMVGMVDLIAASDPKAAGALTAVVRPPHANLWIEFSHAARPLFQGEDRSVGPGIVVPRRIAFHFVTIREHALALPTIRVRMWWDAVGHDLCTTSIMQGEIVGQERAREIALTHENPAWARMERKVEPSDLVVRVHEALGNVLVLRENGLYRGRVDGNAEGGISDEFKRLAAENDWRGESRFSMILLGLLGMGTLVESIPAAHDGKLQAARRRRGALPLLSYDVVRILPHVAERLIPKAEGGSGIEMRGHFVRGHFKRRNGKVFFWSTHQRGNPELGWVEKDYETVTPEGAVPHVP